MLTIPLGGKRIRGDLLLAELAAAGVPATRLIVEGGDLTLVGAGEPHRTAALVVLAAHAPPAERRPRTIAAVRDDILALTAAQRNQLFATVVAWLAVEHPGLLARLGAAIADDEPAP